VCSAPSGEDEQGQSLLLLLQHLVCGCNRAKKSKRQMLDQHPFPCPRAQLLQELEPYMQQALDAVDVLREEDRRRQAALEDMIFGFRRARQSDCEKSVIQS